MRTSPSRNVCRCVAPERLGRHAFEHFRHARRGHPHLDVVKAPPLVASDGDRCVGFLEHVPHGRVNPHRAHLRAVVVVAVSEKEVDGPLACLCDHLGLPLQESTTGEGRGWREDCSCHLGCDAKAFLRNEANRRCVGLKSVSLY